MTRCVATTCISRGLPRRVVDRAARLLGQAEDLARQRPRGRRPAGGQRDPAAVADEELVAELLAQRRDGDRHRRLGDLELGRRGLDGPVPGDEDEGLELRERHDQDSDLSDRLGPVDETNHRTGGSQARTGASTGSLRLRAGDERGPRARSARAARPRGAAARGRALAAADDEAAPGLAGLRDRHRPARRRARLHRRARRRGAHRRDDTPPRAARVPAAGRAPSRSSPTPSA